MNARCQIPKPADAAASRGPKWCFWALLVLTIAVRAGVLLTAPHALQADPDGYRRLAQNVREHGTFGYGTSPTAYRPPLYPLVLAPLVAPGSSGAVPIGVLHLLLGVATVVVVVHVAGS
jgi:hypothetical protein